MSELELHRAATLGLLGFAALVAVSSVRVVAPYGRYGRAWWSGPDLPSWAAWMLMELPQPVGFFVCFAISERRFEAPSLAFAAMWGFHYIYRTFIYPFLPRGSRMSLSVVATGFLLNCVFSVLNGRWLFAIGPDRGASWLSDPRFLAGALLFFSGWTLCATSDRALRRLRKPGEKGYVIPRGWAFRFVSSPNYLGEIVMWLGWSLATWSLAGLAIAAVSAANLVPRAFRNHRWYKERFPDYPAERKALVPFLL